MDPVSGGIAGTTSNLEIIFTPSSNSLSLIAAISHYRKQSSSVSDEKHGWPRGGGRLLDRRELSFKNSSQSL
jgi:hypothetical protein